LVGELHMTVEILLPGRLAKPYELVVDEAILDVVDVLHNCLTLILYKVLHKSIIADGNTKANVAVNYKGRGREQGTIFSYPFGYENDPKRYGKMPFFNKDLFSYPKILFHTF
jgi:hypothetical protein